MTTPDNGPTILLVAGHWLGAWAWDEVVDRLRGADLVPTALTLPGLDPTDPARAQRNLDDQATAIADALTEAGVSPAHPAVIVGHSGANAPISLVLDRHPDLIGRVIWVDSGPLASGTTYAADLPVDIAEVPLPEPGALAAQASLEGLGPEVLARFRARAVPEPGDVLRGTVELANDARFDVPTTLVCCSIPVAHLVELVEAGHPMFAEVAKLRQVDFVDLPTGHWPMWSRPGELAAIIADVAAGAATTEQPGKGR